MSNLPGRSKNQGVYGVPKVGILGVWVQDEDFRIFLSIQAGPQTRTPPQRAQQLAAYRRKLEDFRLCPTVLGQGLCDLNRPFQPTVRTGGSATSGGALFAVCPLPPRWPAKWSHRASAEKRVGDEWGVGVGTQIQHQGKRTHCCQDANQGQELGPKTSKKH